MTENVTPKRCICGKKRASLLAAYGDAWATPRPGGHIEWCLECGGDLHVSPHDAVCMVCGRAHFYLDNGKQMMTHVRPRRSYPTVNGDYCSKPSEE